MYTHNIRGRTIFGVQSRPPVEQLRELTYRLYTKQLSMLNPILTETHSYNSLVRPLLSRNLKKGKYNLIPARLDSTDE